MRVEVGYGKTVLYAEVPDERCAGVLTLMRSGAGGPGGDLVRDALDSPVGSPRLSEIVRPGERVAVITSDLTRPVPSAVLLPPILAELAAGGVRPEDVTVVFALGSHRGHTPDEMRRLVGDELFGRVRCVDSDPGDTVHFGQTRAGTPADITRTVAEADRRVVLGNIEYHYFAGYSGGAKALMPGCSTREAIQHNHSMMVLPGAVAGRLADNPVRADLEEAAALCPIDFMLNVVLGEHKEILAAVAGDITEAHRAGCRFLDSVYRVPLARRADIVVASQGGAPKDINLYQTQKALDNAAHAVKPGGIVILVGACTEGFGEPVFERWLMESDSPDALIGRIQRDFQLGGHKAAAIAMVLKKAEVWLVSAMPPEQVRCAYMRPFSGLQAAVDAALEQAGHGAQVLVMPSAGSVLPVCEEA